VKVQVAEKVRQCTEEHDSMLHERLEHEDRLKKVCFNKILTPQHTMVSEGVTQCDLVSEALSITESWSLDRAQLVTCLVYVHTHANIPVHHHPCTP